MVLKVDSGCPDTDKPKNMVGLWGVKATVITRGRQQGGGKAGGVHWLRVVLTNDEVLI